MSAALRIDPAPSPARSAVPRWIAVGRAGVALVWAAAVVIAVRDKVPTTGSELPKSAAFVIASYPLIDVIASLVGAAFADARVLRFNAAVSALAVVGISIATFTSDAGATLGAFGAWAVVSGVIQLVTALRRRSVLGGQLPMVISGGLSALAGGSFVAASRSDEARLAVLAGYMAVGALLYLVWARRDARPDQSGIRPASAASIASSPKRLRTSDSR